MEDSFAKKKLPYNINAEKSVIGSMVYCLKIWSNSSRRARL